MHAKHADNNERNGLSGRVIGCAFTVPNTLGKGFPGKVDENALAFEVRAAGHYLKASGLRLCLLPNFGDPRQAIKRVAHGL
jgi:hypothetical protein